MTEPQNPRVSRSSTLSTIKSNGAAVARRAKSFMVQAHNPPPAAPKETKERSYPAYELKWEKFKDWLENRFPECKGTFKERRVIEDSYVIHIPESLTSMDRLEINQLRDNSSRGDQAMQAPYVRRAESEEL